MLTKDTFKENDKLKALNLTDEQIAAISEASEADENVVIGENRARWWTSLDRDIEEITGVKKEGGIKSYQVLRGVLSDLQNQASKAGSIATLEKERNDLKKKVGDLEKQIESGSTDAALKAKVADLEQKITDKETEIRTIKDTAETEKQDYETKLGNAQKTNLALATGAAIRDHIVGNNLQYNSTIPKGILGKSTNIAERELLEAYEVTLSENGNGLVFRDKDSKEILINKATSKPYTAGELFYRDNKELFEVKKNQSGGGTGAPGGGTGAGAGGASLDLSGVTNQIDADDMIRNHILTVEKIAKTDPAFADRHKELRAESKVDGKAITELPMRQEADPA